MRLLDAADHDGLAHAVMLESLDELAQLPQRDPMYPVHDPLEGGLGFPGQGHRRDAVTEPSRVLGEEERKAAVAGDQADPFRPRVRNPCPFTPPRVHPILCRCPASCRPETPGDPARPGARRTRYGLSWPLRPGAPPTGTTPGTPA